MFSNFGQQFPIAMDRQPDEKKLNSTFFLIRQRISSSWAF